MKKLLLYGIFAILASMPGSLIPRALGLGGEDWLATATMRYAWSIVFLSAFVRCQQGPRVGHKIISLFREHSRFWLIWALASGPFLYLPFIYAATCVPAWIIAATCRLDMLTMILVLRLFGQRVKRAKAGVLIFVFIGVVLVNIDHASGTWKAQSTWALGLLALSTVLESLSDQMMQDARWGRTGRPSWIPYIKDGVGASVHCWLLLLYIMSLPQLGIMLIVHPVMPTWRQIWCTAIMAACSSIFSIAVWMKFRLSAGTSADHIALTSATPALGIVFAVGAEVWLFGGAWPSIIAFVGIGLVIGGLLWYVRR